MLIGKSVYHVDQGVGKVIGQGGYYNDLTQKVIQGEKYLDEKGLPFLVHVDGKHIQMPTMIFQYGLGAFDLWLLTGKEEYYSKAKMCADWALANQLDNGAWDNFSFYYPNYPFSAMSQGEGISLLLRVYSKCNIIDYERGARKAYEFLISSIKQGGVMLVCGEDVFFKEYVQKPVVLNGWIFALFGLYDYMIYTKTNESVVLWKRSLKTLINHLKDYDNGYWSLYNTEGLIASPFYHKLHIALMEAMQLISNEQIFKNYKDKWEEERNNTFNKTYAFIQKAIQKIGEKE